MTTLGIDLPTGTEVAGVGWVAATVRAGRFADIRFSGERADIRFPLQGPAVEVLIRATTHEFWGGDLESATLSADSQELELVRRSGEWIALQVASAGFPLVAIARVQDRIRSAFTLALAEPETSWRRTTELARDLEEEVERAGPRAGSMDWARRAFDLVNQSTGRYERLIDDLQTPTGDPVADLRRAWLAGQLAPCFSGSWQHPRALPEHGGCSSALPRAHSALQELADLGVAGDVDLGSHLLAVCGHDPCVVIEALHLLAAGNQTQLTAAGEATRHLLAELDVDLGEAVRSCSQIVL